MCGFALVSAGASRGQNSWVTGAGVIGSYEQPNVGAGKNLMWVLEAELRFSARPLGAPNC